MWMGILCIVESCRGCKCYGII